MLKAGLCLVLRGLLLGGTLLYNQPQDKGALAILIAANASNTNVTACYDSGIPSSWAGATICEV